MEPLAGFIDKNKDSLYQINRDDESGETEIRPRERKSENHANQNYAHGLHAFAVKIFDRSGFHFGMAVPSEKIANDIHRFALDIH